MFKVPAIGTIFIAELNEDGDGNPLLVNPGATQDRVKMLEWQLVQARDRAARQNDVREVEYKEITFGNWLYNYQIGRQPGPTGVVGDPDAKPPAPPNEFAVVVMPGQPNWPHFDIQDGAECAVVVADMLRSGVIDVNPNRAFKPRAVCRIPEYVKITAPQH